MAPSSLTYKELYDMTDGFNKDRKLGEGTYGVVYRGGDGENQIAVKKLRDERSGRPDAHYDKEFGNLKKVNHPNIVRIVGYCNETAETTESHDGDLFLGTKTYRLLCFEYMSGSSLKERVRDYLPYGLNWGECYKIVRGICDGIGHIHLDLQPPMRHMDIKPSNILLDENNNAKLADLGLSTVFQDEVTRTTRSSYGTERYNPPEYTRHRHRSSTFDIYSLGVVILELVAGRKAYDKIGSITNETYIHEAVQRWKQKYKESFLESHCEQLKTCIEIGLNCIDSDTKKRPGIQDIIDQLENGTSVSNVSRQNQDMLVAGLTHGGDTEIDVDRQWMVESKEDEEDEAPQLSAGALAEFSEAQPGVILCLDSRSDSEANNIVIRKKLHQFGIRFEERSKLTGSLHNPVPALFLKGTLVAEGEALMQLIDSGNVQAVIDVMSEDP